MGATRARPVILDAGALIQFERGGTQVRDVIRQAELHGLAVVIPSGALGQVWRDGSRQARLAKLLKRGTVIEPLGGKLAQAAGELCGRAGTADVIDATVVLVARRRGGVVLSSDADDLRRLDPALEVVEV